MIDTTLDSTKGEPMSHRNMNVLQRNAGSIFCLAIGIGLLSGLAAKASHDYPDVVPQSGGNATVSKVVPVQSYGPDDTSGVEELYNRLLAPQDQPVDCQPSTGEPLADLMLGITAC